MVENSQKLTIRDKMIQDENKESGEDSLYVLRHDVFYDDD